MIKKVMSYFYRHRERCCPKNISLPHKSEESCKHKKDTPIAPSDTDKFDCYFLFSHGTGKASFSHYLEYIGIRNVFLLEESYKNLSPRIEIIEKIQRNEKIKMVSLGIDRPVDGLPTGLFRKKLPILWMLRDPVALLSSICNMRVNSLLADALFSRNISMDRLGKFKSNDLAYYIENLISNAKAKKRFLNYSSLISSVGDGYENLIAVDTDDIMPDKVAGTMGRIASSFGLKLEEEHIDFLQKSKKDDWTIFPAITALRIKIDEGEILIRIRPEKSFWGFYDVRGPLISPRRGIVKENAYKRIIILKKMTIGDCTYDVLCAVDDRIKSTDDMLINNIINAYEDDISSYAYFADSIYCFFMKHKEIWRVNPDDVINAIRYKADLRDNFMRLMDIELAMVKELLPNHTCRWDHFNKIL